MAYTPQLGSEAYRLIELLVRDAPYQGDAWLTTKVLADAVGMAFQSSVHRALNAAVSRRCVMRDEDTMRWQAGPEAVESLGRASTTRAYKTMGFPNAKEREPVPFTPRPGGTMDRVVEHLRQRNPELEPIDEPDLRLALGLPHDADLKQLCRLAVEAGALVYTVIPKGIAGLVTCWSLGDGIPISADGIEPTPSYTKPTLRAAQKRAQTQQVENHDEADTMTIEAPPTLESESPPASERLPELQTDISTPPITIPWPPTQPRGVQLPFVCAVYSTGKATIQKGYGAVELEPDELLELFEHIAPYAQRVGRSQRGRP